MKTISFIVLVLATVWLSEARKLPSYVVPCKKTDRAKFNKCAKENGIKAIPSILKGDKDYKVPPLSPFHLERIDINPGPSLSIKLFEITLKGLEKAVIKDIDVDFDKRHAQIKLYFDRIEVESKYDIDGKISLLPIKGKGPAHLAFDGLDITYSVDFDLIKKSDGKEYVSEKLRPSVSFTLKKAHFQFDNLFEGDKTLGEQTNKFLNENSEEVVKDVGASVSETISAVCTNILKRLTSVIPYDEVFLP